MLKALVVWYYIKSINMQEVVANVDHIKFSMEVAIENQLGVLPLPFTGMDSKWTDFVISFHIHYKKINQN